MWDASIVTTVVLAGVGMVSTVGVWASKQATRISVLETIFEKHEALANERHSDLKKDLDAIRSALGVKANPDQRFNR